MKLPNAVKCIQFCDHQVSDGKPFRHSEQQQQPQEEQQKEQPQKEQQQSTPNRHHETTTTTAECSQPSSLEHDEYHKTVAPQGHLAVEAGLGGKESRDKHPEQIKGESGMSYVSFFCWVRQVLAAHFCTAKLAYSRMKNVVCYRRGPL